MNCQAQKGRRRASRTPLPSGALALGARRERERRDVREERYAREERHAREERYAAGKWGSAPAAAALPPPPTHWRRGERCRPEPDRALPLKLLLNVA